MVSASYCLIFYSVCWCDDIKVKLVSLDRPIKQAIIVNRVYDFLPLSIMQFVHIHMHMFCGDLRFTIYKTKQALLLLPIIITPMSNNNIRPTPWLHIEVFITGLYISFHALYSQTCGNHYQAVCSL